MLESYEEMNEMKKRFAALFLAFALLLSLLCACTQQVKPQETGNGEPVQTPSPQETTTPPPAQREVAVSELYSEDGNATDDTGYTYTYSFHVPQIKDDTPAAASINIEIAALYGELAADGLNSIKNKEEPGYNIVMYDTYRSGDVLSLVVKCAYYYGAYEGFSTYNYDTAKGVELTNADILAMKGITEEQYLYSLRCAAVKFYDDQYFLSDGDDGFDFSPGNYRERRVWTLSDRNITSETPLYLDNDGVLHTIAAVGSNVGGAWFCQDIVPDFDGNTADLKAESALDFLTATMRDGALTIRLSKTPRGVEILEADAFMEMPYGEELPVNGLYGDYTKIFCDTAGEANTPYVFLLTREGWVYYIDVVSCLRGGYFCASGPLLGAADVKDFSSDMDGSGIRHVYAISGSGESIELDELIEYDQIDMDYSLQGDWGDYEASLGLALMDGNGDNFVLNFYTTEIETHGSLKYLGMTQNGSVYYYHLWGKWSNGPGLEGTIALEAISDYTEDEYTTTLYVTELGGTPFIGENTGDTTALWQTFG